LETSQVITICYGIIIFLCGIVINSIRNTVIRLEENDRAIFERLRLVEEDNASLQSAHNTVMDMGKHKK
jgi:hypothetical protein